MTASGDFLDLGGLIADMNQAERVQESVALSDNQNIIAAGEERNAPSGLRLRGIAEKFRGNLQWRRRRGQLRITKGRTLAAASPATRLRRRRGAGDKNIPVRARIFKLAQPVELIESKTRLLHIERFEFCVGGEHARRVRAPRF